MRHRVTVIAVTLVIAGVVPCSSEDIETPPTNLYGRARTELSGEWRYLVDPLKEGIRSEGSRYSVHRDERQTPGGPLVEYDWDQAALIPVPSDWNSRVAELQFYAGMVWYRKSFVFFPEPGRRYLMYFEAVNYHAHIYLNGQKLAEHEGGFTPFAIELTGKIAAGRNSLVVGVDSSHTPETVPEIAYDWWNYGGITRPVWLVEVQETYIHDYRFTFRPREGLISGQVRIEGPDRSGLEVLIEIPELATTATARTSAEGIAILELRPDSLQLWSPKDPNLYRVVVTAGDDRVEEELGFRTIEVRSRDILLNGEAIFLRGISIHEEPIGPVGRRTLDWQSAEVLLRLAKELGCNFVRLAHYPHSEKMTRLADRLGLLVWSEVPVYWDIAYTNPHTLEVAVAMVTENVMRDRNRASVIVWSVANETPTTIARDAFLGAMIDRVRSLDATRLVSAALDRTTKEGDRITVDDPLGARLDLLAVNEYEGWYGARSIDRIADVTWDTPYDKPMIFSEFGAGALHGHHGSKHERWTEEYQQYFYQQTLKMAEGIPFLRGASPWILKDFRSPRRFHALYQNYWNRKGLVSETGDKKLAFDVLRDWYETMADRWREVFR